MSSNQNSNISNNQNGKVIDKCKEFLMKGDELLASRLQDEEFFEHYDKNRKNNKTIRVDVPVAKDIHNCEYQELLRKHEMLVQIEKEDALIALEIQNELMKEETNELIKQQKLDQELAKELQAKEILFEKISQNNNQDLSNEIESKLNIDTEDEDFKLAFKLQKQEESKLKQKLRAETEDERLAREIQEQEKSSLKKPDHLARLKRFENNFNDSVASSLLSLSEESSSTADVYNTMPIEKMNNEQKNYQSLHNKFDSCDSSSLMKQRNTVKSQENLILIDKKIDLETDESIRKTNTNIVEFIDPTYKKSSINYQTIDEKNGNKKQLVPDYIYDIKPENLDNYENDTDIFLPVQGQKRINGTIKSKNKKSQSQCLHQ